MWTPVLAFVVGSVVGSFLNVCIDRLPRGQSIVRPPSHCDGCGKRLAVFELIPIVSYLWLKGRCRNCGARIPGRTIAVELLTGLLFTSVSFSYGFGIEFLVLAVYASLFLVLAFIDLEHGLILNKIVYPALLISLVLSPFWPGLGFPREFLGANNLLHSFLSSLVATGIFVTPFLVIILLYRGSMGWGDVKMAGLIGMVTGFPLVLAAMAAAFISGGLVAILLLLLSLRRRRDTVPFAPYLALGAIVALFWGKELITWYAGFYP